MTSKQALLAKKGEKRYMELFGKEYPEGCLPIDAWNKYVDIHKDRRIVIVLTQGHQFEEWNTEAFVGDNFITDGLELGPKGDKKTIYISLDTQKRHYTYLRYKDRTANQGTSKKVKHQICPGCLELFPVGSIKQKQDYRLHACEDLEICEGCGLLFDDEHFSKHIKVKGTDCQECDIHLHGEYCASKHADICKQNAKHCLKCKGAHALGSDCLPFRCPGCSRKLKEDQLMEHRCYFTNATETPKNKKIRELKEEINKCKSDMGDLEKLGLEEERLWNYYNKRKCVNDATAKLEEEEESKKSIKPETTWAFDLESAVRKITGTQAVTANRKSISQRDVYEQVPILGGIYCEATKECHIWENWNDDPAENIFDKFLEFFTDPTRIANKEKHLVYAHNGGKYDWRLLWDHIMSTDKWKGKGLIKGSTIMEGSNIKQMTIGIATLHDSYNHISKPLRLFPSMFGLEDIAKGTFPYSFCELGVKDGETNRMDYRGPMPPIEYYQFHRNRIVNHANNKAYPDFRTCIKQEIAESKAWYESERIKYGENGWCLKTEYSRYFKPDLEILARGMNKYAQICVDHGIVNPIGVMTLASNAMKTFRTSFMDRSSFNQLAPNQQKQLSKNMVPRLRYYPTINTKPCGTNEEACARKAYAGGRTELFKLYHKVDPSKEKLWGVDACSMYPSKCVNHTFPTGDYVFTPYCVGEQPILEEFLGEEGVARVEIEHPKGLRVPLLWRKVITDGSIKLGFTNLPCLTQTEIEHWEKYVNQPEEVQISHTYASPNHACNMCEHIEKQTVTVYTMPEIRTALSIGYKLRHVYWTLFSTESSSTLFNEYYSKTFGLKTQCGKAPGGYDYDSAEDCDRLRRNLRETANIIIPDAINPRDWYTNNKPVKEVAKLYANSLYGKFGADPHKTSTLLFEDDFNGALDALASTTKKSTSFSYGSTIIVKQKDFSHPSAGYGNTNVLIASYVTGYARIEWWEMATFFAENGTLLYGDTDSVIGTLPLGVTPPKMGIFLGDWEDDFGYEVSEFVAIGAKSYMVKDTDGHVRKAKFKGLTLNNGINAELLTFEWMHDATKKMVLGETTKIEGEDFRMRQHDKREELGMTSEMATKEYEANMMLLKGDLAVDGNVYPFGSSLEILGEAVLVKAVMNTE